MEKQNKRLPSSQATKDFQQIFKQEFGVEISEQEAQEQGAKLLRFFSLIYKPIPKEWINRKGMK